MMRVLLCALLCFVSCYGYEDVTLVEYVDSRPNYSTFQRLLRLAGLTDILTQTGPYTLFVPSDAAFDKLGQDTVDGYSSTQLKSIIKYHIVDSYLLLPMVSGKQELNTLLGEALTISSAGGAVTLNDIATVNPNQADNIVNNGVVQTIDTVLMPPGPYLTGTTVAQALILRDDIFKDILLAFMFANMLNLLEEHEFTVFAPTDSAYAKYGRYILRPHDPAEETHYQEFLKYCIVPGSKKLEDLTDGMKLYTLQGTTITITRNTTGVYAEYAKITEPDIFAANGFIHAIDDILAPEEYRVPPPDWQEPGVDTEA